MPVPADSPTLRLRREPARRRRTTRTIAVVAVVATVAYLAWRITATIDLSVWWVSLPLLALELHAAVSLGLFVWSTWDLDAVAPPEPVHRAPARVAVLIPTYNEAPEVLLPVIAAAVELEPAHETWVLDDGGRPEIADLAAALGARYLARPTHEHAKAGNVNHALEHVGADFVAILDADHVALPGLLVDTLGYFADERLALVQTPQDFYNVDSFEHARSGRSGRHRRRRYNEQALFYRVIQPGKNRWGAAFWCGTGAVVRVAALVEVGGVATDSITEDILTTVRLHRRGWRTVYHNDVLARGLAAADAHQYATQRLRWGTGAMQVLRGPDNPLTCDGLRPAQRLCYAATLLGWFDAWRSLGFLLVPMVVLATGAVPIRADVTSFALAFAAAFCLQRLALARLGRGLAPAVVSTVFDIVRLAPNLAATASLLGSGDHAFTVTPKGRTGDDRAQGREPVLLDAVLLAGTLAAVWFAASAAGWTPLHYGVPWSAYGAAAWLVVNTALVTAAVARIRDRRFAAERRASVRFAVTLTGEVAEPGSPPATATPVSVEDLSLTGARVCAPGLPPSGAEVRLAVRTGGAHAAPVVLDGVVRGRWGDVAGIEFLPAQVAAQSTLARRLFHDEVAWGVGEAPAPTVARQTSGDRAPTATPAAPAAPAAGALVTA